MAGEGSVQERLTQEREYRLNDKRDDQLGASAIGIGCSTIVESSEMEGVKRVAVEGEGSTDAHSCAEHSEVMNPALWSALPNELLHLVLARLPVPDSLRLQCLSKEWKWNVTAKESEFRRTCASVKPSTRVFAIFEGKSIEIHKRFFTLYAAKSNRWHRMACPDRCLPAPERIVFCHSTSASHGGLVCFYLEFFKERGKHASGVILVGNPLTCEWKTLPPIGLDFFSVGQRGMLQLVTDRDTKCYQIFFVSVNAPSNGAAIYNSTTGTWRSVNSLTCGAVFGYLHQIVRAHEFQRYYHKTRMGPCAFDCRQGKVVGFDDRNNPCLGAKNYTLVRDRLFVLGEQGYVEGTGRRRQVRMYHKCCVSEYQGQVDSSGLHWVKVKVHNNCGHNYKRIPFRSYDIRLHACEGFFLLIATNYRGRDCRPDIAWLYDMHEEKWRKLSDVSNVRGYFEHGTMCELRWDAIP